MQIVLDDLDFTLNLRGIECFTGEGVMCGGYPRIVIYTSKIYSKVVYTIPIGPSKPLCLQATVATSSRTATPSGTDWRCV